ncbi:MAG: hypothetical protein WCK00_17835 [Deltaproteobacteria bacterium]
MRLVPPLRDSSLPRPCEMATNWNAERTLPRSQVKARPSGCLGGG